MLIQRGRCIWLWSLEITYCSHCGEGLNGANILEVASALISTTVHWGYATVHWWNGWLSRMHGLLPIYFPVWYHRWWSNLGEFQRQENKTGLSYGLPRFLMMEFHVWQCLYLYLIRAARLSCLQIRHVWWKHVRCNNLSFDLVHCGGIGFSFQLPSFGQLPVNYSVFLDISGRSVLQIYEYGFTFSLQLAFLPFLTKFMNGLVKA